MANNMVLCAGGALIIFMVALLGKSVKAKRKATGAKGRQEQVEASRSDASGALPTG